MFWSKNFKNMNEAVNIEKTKQEIIISWSLLHVPIHAIEYLKKYI